MLLEDDGPVESGTGMGIETERRFVIDSSALPTLLESAESSMMIVQWYPPIGTVEMVPEKRALSIDNRILIEGIPDPEWTGVCTLISEGKGARLRTRPPMLAWLTVKGDWGGDGGVSRVEYEWPVDPALVTQLADINRWSEIRKRRLICRGDDGLVWEVDVFTAHNDGLIIAEVELEDGGVQPMLPEWVGDEVTGMVEWGNAALARIPESS